MVQIKIVLLLNLVPEIAGKIITVYMEQFRENAARLTGVGVLVLVVTAVAMMLTVDRSINAIWRVRRSRPFWLSMVGYLGLLTAAPLLIGLSVSITTYLMSLERGLTQVPRGAHSLLLQLAPASVSAVAFFLLYRIVPHRKVPWRDALIGGAVAALLFEGAKEVFAIYVVHAPGYSVVYGAFAALPFFLLWIYLSWLVVLLGAELTASLEDWRSGAWRRVARGEKRPADAASVVRRLFAAEGAPMSFSELQLDTGMPNDELEGVLHHLTASGLVAQAGDARFLIASPAARAAAPARAVPPAHGPPRVRKARRGKARSARSSRPGRWRAPA
jgi:membrane protein